jgi:hypothetical protein
VTGWGVDHLSSSRARIEAHKRRDGIAAEPKAATLQMQMIAVRGVVARSEHDVEPAARTAVQRVQERGARRLSGPVVLHGQARSGSDPVRLDRAGDRRA